MQWRGASVLRNTARRSKKEAEACDDPYVADPGTLESSVRPRLINDPAHALRTLHPRVRALDSGIGGVTTVRFDLTGDGVARNPRVVGSSGLQVMDEAIAAIATDFEFVPGTTASDTAEVPLEYVVGFEADRRGRLVRWLSAISDRRLMSARAGPQPRDRRSASLPLRHVLRVHRRLFQHRVPVVGLGLPRRDAEILPLVPAEGLRQQDDLPHVVGEMGQRAQ